MRLVAQRKCSHFDASLLMVEKLKASSLSALYDLKRSLSLEENHVALNIVRLVRDGRSFIGAHEMADRKAPVIHAWAHNSPFVT